MLTQIVATVGSILGLYLLLIATGLSCHENQRCFMVKGLILIAVFGAIMFGVWA